MQALHALHHQAVGADALDAGAHLDQQVGQVGHLRLARGVLEHGLAVGQRGGHQQVLGAGHGDHVGHHARALQALGAGMDKAVLNADLGAHGLQALDVLVDRARANGAAAGQRHTRLAEARYQRAQHQDRGAHGLDQFVGGLWRVDVGAVERHARAILLGLHAHLAQQLERGAHVLQPGNVVERDGVRAKQPGAQDRQRGVLGAGYADLASQRAIALDLEFVHVLSIPAGRPLASGMVHYGPWRCVKARRRSIWYPWAAARGAGPVCHVRPVGRPACWSVFFRAGPAGSGAYCLPSPACVCHSAGVSVFIDSAWISARMRSPSAA